MEAFTGASFSCCKDNNLIDIQLEGMLGLDLYACVSSTIKSQSSFRLKHINRVYLYQMDGDELFSIVYWQGLILAASILN